MIKSSRIESRENGINLKLNRQRKGPRARSSVRVCVRVRERYIETSRNYRARNKRLLRYPAFKVGLSGFLDHLAQHFLAVLRPALFHHLALTKSPFLWTHPQPVSTPRVDCSKTLAYRRARCSPIEPMVHL